MTARGRFTNIPSDDNNSNFSSSDKVCNLFSNQAHDISHRVFKQFINFTPVFAIIVLNSFIVGVC